MIIRKDIVEELNNKMVTPEARLIYLSLFPILKKNKKTFKVDISDFCSLTGMDPQQCGWKLKELRMKGLIGNFYALFGRFVFEKSNHKELSPNYVTERVKEMMGVSA